MLYYPKQISLQADQLLVDIPEAALFIKKWLTADPELAELSMRWAAARDGQGSLIVIGVRHEGRGFDVAFRPEAWKQLAAEPDILTIRYRTGGQMGGGKHEQSDGSFESGELDVELPAGSFRDFLDSCRQQVQADPGKQVIRGIVEFFKV